MKTFTAEQLNHILADELTAPIPSPSSIEVNRISTDTRTIVAGDMFVALSGERFDGHDFINTAVENGASLLMVENAQDTDLPQVVVKNTRLALGKMAAAIRKDFVARGGKIVGLTGSVGKTTSKQMLASILSQVGKTHATKGNLNNDLGVPFTWFDLPEDAAFAVIEMGANHQGEIDYLAKITQPQVAMITNAGDAHLAGFGGLDGVAKGKGELFENLRAGDIAVMNIDDDYADYWQGLLADGVAVKTFSLANDNADVFATAITDNGASFVLNAGAEAVTINLPITGTHNVMNALGCAACALALNIPLHNIVVGLESFENPKGRLQTTHIGSLTMIDDSYNANPTSMRAASDMLANYAGYKIMVVGDMGELGDSAREYHGQLGADLQGKADAFLCLGELMQAFAEQNDKAQHFMTLAALNSELLQLLHAHPDATILIKGSRSMAMERVVDYVTTQMAE